MFQQFSWVFEYFEFEYFFETSIEIIETHREMLKHSGGSFKHPLFKRLLDVSFHGCLNNFTGHLNNFPECLNIFPGFLNNFLECFNNFPGCLNNFPECLNNFLGCFINFLGVWIFFLGVWIICLGVLIIFLNVLVIFLDVWIILGVSIIFQVFQYVSDNFAEHLNKVWQWLKLHKTNVSKPNVLNQALARSSWFIMEKLSKEEIFENYELAAQFE